MDVITYTGATCHQLLQCWLQKELPIFHGPLLWLLIHSNILPLAMRQLSKSLSKYREIPTSSDTSLWHGCHRSKARMADGTKYLNQC